MRYIPQKNHKDFKRLIWRIPYSYFSSYRRYEDIGGGNLWLGRLYCHAPEVDGAVGLIWKSGVNPIDIRNNDEYNAYIMQIEDIYASEVQGNESKKDY